MRCLLLVLAIAALTVTGCGQGRKGGDVPNTDQPRDASPTDARPVLKAEWSAYEVVDGFVPSPAKVVAKGKFDRIHSGMTLRELTDILGRGWMSRYEGCGIITWSGEDGRQLQVLPTTYRPEEVIDAGPRQVGGTGGRGRMWMTRLGKDQKLEDLSIPPK
jgi:hypothetical protein